MHTLAFPTIRHEVLKDGEGNRSIHFGSSQTHILRRDNVSRWQNQNQNPQAAFTAKPVDKIHVDGGKTPTVTRLANYQYLCEK